MRRRGGGRRRLAALPFLACGPLLVHAEPARAQDFRALATSSVRYVELRPVVQDTVPLGSVRPDGAGGFTFEGRPVFCTPGIGCTFYRSAGEESALAGSQDLSLTAWGLGVRGLSVTALLRARVRLSGDFVWPRSDDRLDAILAYGELQRGDWRFRLGRQETLSGLGFSGFDGGSARWGGLPSVALEAYAGRSLARGLSEPRNEALRGLEDFVLDKEAWVLGGFARAALGGASSLGVRYQREIWSDRSGLVSERASLDGATGILAPVQLEGAFDWDVGFGRVGKGHLTARYPLPAELLAGVVLEGTVRRYLPYFEMSTIWGFFSPVPYHEAVLRARAPFAGGTTLQLLGGWRRYGDTSTPVVFAPLEDDGWRTEVEVLASAGESLELQGRWQLEWGVGAVLNSVEAEARWRPGDRWELGALATAFQQFQEFRVGEGRVWGAGVIGGAELAKGARLDGGFALYRHAPEGRAVNDAWNQARAWTSLTVPFGEAAGEARPRRWRR